MSLRAGIRVLLGRVGLLSPIAEIGDQSPLRQLRPRLNPARRLAQSFSHSGKAFALTAATLAFAVTPGAAYAHNRPSPPGWGAAAQNLDLGYFPDAGSACAAEFNAYVASGFFQPTAVNDGFASNGTLGQGNCYWHSTGAGGGQFMAYTGGGPPGANLSVSQPCNCGTPPASTGRPIDILSGSKQFSATDYDNASHSLWLTRLYSSQRLSGGASDYRVLDPLGLANWLFDFQFELQIGPLWTSGSNYQVTLLTPKGDLSNFQYNSGNLQLLPSGNGTFDGPQTDYTLAKVGSWPTPLSSLTSSSTQWTLVDADDTTWTLQTFPDPDITTAVFDVARPVQAVRRGGLTWTFAYGPQTSNPYCGPATPPIQLCSITDSFGNTINFGWVTSTFFGLTTQPAAIATAYLPGGYQVGYAYAPLRGIVSNVPTPALLTLVQYVDNSGISRDSTAYQYSNAAFPTSLTGILDATGVQRWGVSYDPVSGYAATSSLNGTAFSAAVTGSIAPNAGVVTGPSHRARRW